MFHVFDYFDHCLAVHVRRKYGLHLGSVMMCGDSHAVRHFVHFVSMRFGYCYLWPMAIVICPAWRNCGGHSYHFLPVDDGNDGNDGDDGDDGDVGFAVDEDLCHAKLQNKRGENCRAPTGPR